MISSILKKMSTRQYKEKIYESTFTEDKLANLIYPQQALGPYVDEDMDESVIALSTIILSSTIIVIMSTVVYQGISSLDNDEDDTLITNYAPDLSAATLALTWVVFVSFIFLTFGATRIFHITILIGIIITAGYLYSEIQHNENVDRVYKNMVIVILTFSAVIFCILAYYLAISRTVSDSKEYRERERLQRMNNKYNEKVEMIRIKHDKKVDELVAQQKALEEDLKESEKQREKLERMIGRN